LKGFFQNGLGIIIFFYLCTSFSRHNIFSSVSNLFIKVGWSSHDKFHPCLCLTNHACSILRFYTCSQKIDPHFTTFLPPNYYKPVFPYGFLTGAALIYFDKNLKNRIFAI